MHASCECSGLFVCGETRVMRVCAIYAVWEFGTAIFTKTGIGALTGLGIGSHGVPSCLLATTVFAYCACRTRRRSCSRRSRGPCCCPATCEKNQQDRVTPPWLVGNTIIAGARSGHDGVLLNILGLLLCGAWAWMTWVGWDEFHKSLRAGAAVPVEPALNPLKQFSSTSRWDPIFTVANGVVVIFALIYLFGLCRALTH
jgi:hypothetical protein